MSHWITFRCLGCGKVLHAVAASTAAARCDACGSPLCALGKREPRASRSKPFPRRVAAPDEVSSTPRRRWAVAACVLLGVVGLLGIGGEVGFLEAGRRADAERSANEAVAAKVKVAQTAAARAHWDEAIQLLHDALATPGATGLAEVDQLLRQAQRARAESVLTAARQAVQDHEPARAQELLGAYLANPDAADKDRAARLRDDLALATSTAKAAEVLRQLPDGALAAFADGGSLPVLQRVEDADVCGVYARTLRAGLAAEQERRAELSRLAREEQKQRLARVSATPAYKELLSFLDASRKSRTTTRVDPRLLGYLYQELNITDAAEQQKTLAELTASPQEVRTLQQSIARERLTLKERFRSYDGFDQRDRETFERRVDEEMERLLGESAAASQAPAN
jgi:hypothetical protein